jgi:UDP-3-O-[3-hydroxymyristoyl] glucosamine N-acyltransferase
MNRRLFFESSAGLTVREVAELTGAVPTAEAPLDRVVDDVAPLDLAGIRDVTFLDKDRYLNDLTATDAGICLLSERFAGRAPAHVAVLIAPQPYRAFVAVAQRLYPGAARPSSLFGAEEAAKGAWVHASARIEKGVIIDPLAIVGPRAEIGAATIIQSGAVIGPDVHIGRGCSIGAGASITNALIGDRVVIHPGCRIGQDGFGYAMGEAGLTKVPQVRRVIVQADVEIGAGTCIDRGSTRDTVIGEGTKIDNLVQVGHNVTIGRHCVIVSQVGISGSVSIGDFVMLGGKVGIADHLTIGSGARIAAAAALMSDVPPGATYMGYPAEPAREWLRGLAAMRRLVRKLPRSAASDPNREDSE